MPYSIFILTSNEAFYTHFFDVEYDCFREIANFVKMRVWSTLYSFILIY